MSLGSSIGICRPGPTICADPQTFPQSQPYATPISVGATGQFGGRPGLRRTSANEADGAAGAGYTTGPAGGEGAAADSGCRVAQ